MAQVLAVAVCFNILRKDVFTSFLYAWFMFKIFMGIIAGLSAFLFSALQIMILVLICWAIIYRTSKGTSAPPVALFRWRA
jgi:hypothetical protein